MTYIPNSNGYLSFIRCKDLKSFFNTWPDPLLLNGERKLMKEHIIDFFKREDVQNYIKEDDFMHLFRVFREEYRVNLMILIHFLYLCGVDSVENISYREAEEELVDDYLDYEDFNLYFKV